MDDSRNIGIICDRNQYSIQKIYSDIRCLA